MTLLVPPAETVSVMAARTGPRVRPGAAAEQDDGKHRQDTGGQARNDSADWADQHQRHATTSR